jgi:hypothetical protein
MRDEVIREANLASLREAPERGRGEPRPEGRLSCTARGVAHRGQREFVVGWLCLTAHGAAKPDIERSWCKRCSGCAWTEDLSGASIPGLSG